MAEGNVGVEGANRLSDMVRRHLFLPVLIKFFYGNGLVTRHGVDGQFAVKGFVKGISCFIGHKAPIIGQVHGLPAVAAHIEP